MATIATATARLFTISGATDLSLKATFSPPLIRRFLPSISARKRQFPTVISCLISGVDGGGVPDEFVFTRKSDFGREFSVIANMLRRIEPLDNSIISKGVSDSAKDSMKQTISTMLGLLPSDQFSVTVRISKHPLDRLIVSSIITGYTLWNAEYRISLMRNFNMPLDTTRSEYQVNYEVSEVKQEKRVHEPGEGGGGIEDFEKLNLQCLGDLSPEATDHIQQLELELSTLKQELHVRKQENMRMEHMRKSNNDLLEYLRSLESEMVIELSRPSSHEVAEIIHQLAQNTLQTFFKDQIVSDDDGDSSVRSTENYPNIDNKFCDTIGTSRDYLAKLLFWCMLLGHHLRGLENRLHLSCAVGLL